jgi:hypothetical protein
MAKPIFEWSSNQIALPPKNYHLKNRPLLYFNFMSARAIQAWHENGKIYSFILKNFEL